MTVPPLPYTAQESDAAAEDWNASCGPHSIAAACQASLKNVQRAIPGFRGWMNPTQITLTLRALDVPHHVRHYVSPIGESTPPDPYVEQLLPIGPEAAAILRIQFEGPWLAPGVPAGAAYKKTHYIALYKGWIMDPMEDPNQWVPVEHWISEATPIALAGVKNCTGWHFTHAWILSK